MTTALLHIVNSYNIISHLHARVNLESVRARRRPLGGRGGRVEERIDEVEAKDGGVEFVAIPDRADGCHLVDTVAVV